MLTQWLRHVLRPVIHNLDDIVESLDTIVELLHAQQTQARTTGEEIMADLSVLTDQVAQTTAVETSALTLIQGISQRLADAAGDPAAVQTLVDELNASSSALAAAVAANTPAPPVDETPVEPTV